MIDRILSIGTVWVVAIGMAFTMFLLNAMSWQIAGAEIGLSGYVAAAYWKNWFNVVR